MPIVFEDMEKERGNLSVGVYAPSGAGKTTGALKIAEGIRNALYPDKSLKEIGLIVDTEKRASTKAVGRTVGGEVISAVSMYSFEPPYHIIKLIEVLEYAQKTGKKIVILDSYTAFWSGKDGILERVSEIESSGEAKKLYGPWSEKEIVTKKNYLKWLIRGTDMHLIVTLRAKTEYVIEVNKYGKQAPKAIGLKEDMQADLRYEFDVVFSIDKDTHEISIEKDNIGFKEIREASEEPNRPLSIQDGFDLATIVASGISEEELEKRRKQKIIDFILSEKSYKSAKVKAFEETQKVVFTQEYCEKLSKETLTKIAKVIEY